MIFLFVSAVAASVTHADTCDARVFNGAYGFSLTGATHIGDRARPVAVIGRLLVQDSEHLAGVSSASFMGLVFGNRVIGTYKVQTDCTITWTFQDSSGGLQHFAGNMTVDGSRIEFRQTDSDSPQNGLMLRSISACSEPGLVRTFDFAVSGTTVNLLNPAESRTVDLQGAVTTDGAHHLAYVSDTVEPPAPAGTYELSEDCFVTLVVSLPSGQEPPPAIPGSPSGGVVIPGLPANGHPTPGLHFRAIVVDNGRQLLGMQIDPATTVALLLTSSFSGM
jgi:hypothetical protein